VDAQHQHLHQVTDFTHPTVVLLVQQLLAKGEDVHVELQTHHGRELGKLEGIVLQADGTYQLTTLNIMLRQPYNQHTFTAASLEKVTLKKDGGGWLFRTSVPRKAE
jgi:hypothetical protein